MQLTIEIPDSVKNRVINSVCECNAYQDTVRDAQGNEVSNPQTKAQFAKQVIINYLKQCVRSSEENAASRTAVEAARAKVDSEISLT